MKVIDIQVETKKLNEHRVSEIIKQINSLAELIRARQEEKQAVIDEFNNESKRFFLGKISERTIKSSIKREREEIKDLDKEIKDTIKQIKSYTKKLEELILEQFPKKFSVKASGISEIVKKVKGGRKKK
jgi:seryl-tRNA synthetase